MAGLPLGPGQLLEAYRALAVVDITDREEFYWTLHCVFVRRPEESELFQHAFGLFWRPPDARRLVLDELLGRSQATGVRGTVTRPPSTAREVLGERAASAHAAEESLAEDDALALPGYSAAEVLRNKDFDQMDTEELAEARRLVSRMKLSVDTLPTRRYRRDPRGERYDLRATLRAAVRAGHGHIPLQRRTRRRQAPPLVVLCDISGSMRSYTRMLLHFLHALSSDNNRIHTFLFGTRLTNATPHMRRKNPDKALRQLGEAVLDWDGGTRIGHSIADFNRRWSREVLTPGAVVVLISDGLDQEGGEGLEAAMMRLHRSCRRLIWLNPLVRYEGFEPQAAGIRAMIRHVDDLRTIVNLRSLEHLAEALEDLNRPRSLPDPWVPLLRSISTRAMRDDARQTQAPRSRGARARA